MRLSPLISIIYSCAYSRYAECNEACSAPDHGPASGRFDCHVHLLPCRKINAIRQTKNTIKCRTIDSIKLGLDGGTGSNGADCGTGPGDHYVLQQPDDQIFLEYRRFNSQ